MIWTYALGSVLVVSAASLVGVFTLSLGRTRLQRITLYLVSLAVGGLFGDALIHLLPETYLRLGAGLLPATLVITGLIVFFVLEKFIRWRHCHVSPVASHVHPVVTMNLIGDGVHNLIDGALIAASYAVSVPLGITTTLAVLLHEIPQEIGDFGVLVHGGLPVRRALAFNFLSALAALLGAVLVLVLGTRIAGLAVYLVPVTAGGFLYIAGADLIPELQHDVAPRRSLGQFLLIIVGIGLMALLRLFG